MKFIFIMSLSVFMSASTFAQSSGSTGGAGFYNHLLRDLVEGRAGVCDATRSTRTLLNEPQNFKLKQTLDSIFTSLNRLNPYMGFRLKKELNGLHWCLTSHLIKMNLNDIDAIYKEVLPDDIKEYQVAIRDLNSNQVYLDLKKLKTAPLEHQAMTLIHEALHSFLVEHESLRNLKIRTLTKAIHDLHLYFKKPIRPLEDVREDFNTALASNKFLSHFETIEFGQAFYRFEMNPNQDDARLLARLGSNPAEWLEVMINQVNRPSILAYTPFKDTLLENYTTDTQYLPDSYRFDTPELILTEMDYGVFHKRWSDDFLDGKNFSSYKQSLGSCTLRAKAEYVFYHRNSWEYRSDYTLKAHAFYHITPNGNELRTFKLEVDQDFIEDEGNSSFTKKYTKAYHQQLEIFVQALKMGFCD